MTTQMIHITGLPSPKCSFIQLLYRYNCNLIYEKFIFCYTVKYLCIRPV